MGELSAMQAFGNELIPRERFTSVEFVALEYERLWPRVWQVACREEFTTSKTIASLPSG